jgi:hypothetical protein
MLHLLQDSLEDVHTSVGHMDLGLLVVGRHKVIVTLTGTVREGGREKERENNNICVGVYYDNIMIKVLLLTALMFLSMLRGRLNRTLWL